MSLKSGKSSLPLSFSPFLFLLLRFTHDLCRVAVFRRYVNAALQVLFFVPEVRGALMQHLRPTVVGSELGEELGFLFQMLDKAKYAPARSVRMCVPCIVKSLKS